MNNTYTVYKHTTPSGKIYIGITSKDVNKRWLNGRGYAKNKHFWNAIQLYGWSNIKHEILETGLSKEEACEKEKLYIKRFNACDGKHGYNLTTGGEIGTEHTAESRRKLSESKKGKRYNIGVPFTEERKQHLKEHHADVRGEKNPNYGKKWTSEQISLRQSHRVYTYGANNPCARPILQLDMEGNVVKKWGSIVDACKQYTRTAIKDCLKGKQKQHKGFQWRYDDGQA